MEIKPLNLPEIEVYQDIKREWRWRIISLNGKIIGASTESFTTKQNCIKNLNSIGEAMRNHREF
jgi:uncharacterized protein YegP (UPF0339 family)